MHPRYGYLYFSAERLAEAQIRLTYDTAVNDGRTPGFGANAAAYWGVRLHRQPLPVTAETLRTFESYCYAGAVGVAGWVRDTLMAAYRANEGLYFALRAMSRVPRDGHLLIGRADPNFRALYPNHDEAVSWLELERWLKAASLWLFDNKAAAARVDMPVALRI